MCYAEHYLPYWEMPPGCAPGGTLCSLSPLRRCVPLRVRMPSSSWETPDRLCLVLQEGFFGIWTLYGYLRRALYTRARARSALLPIGLRQQSIVCTAEH